MIEPLLDLLSLRPSRHTIPLDGARCQRINLAQGEIEIVVRDVNLPHGDTPTLHVIKFIGAGGRAENVTDSPFDVWSDIPGRVWVPNPPGYGNSRGRPTLRKCLHTAERIYRHVTERDSSAPVLFLGQSLGGAVAISMAARFPCAGLIIRDPAVIEQLMMKRFGMFPRITAAFTQRLPAELNALRAASACHVPAVIVSSRKDRIVPIECQDQLIEAYAGDKQVVWAHQADHGEPLNQTETAAFRDALAWLRQQCLPASS